MREIAWTLQTPSGEYLLSAQRPPQGLIGRRVDPEERAVVEAWLARARRQGLAREQLADVARILAGTAVGRDLAPDALVREAFARGAMVLRRLPHRVPRSREEVLETFVHDGSRVREELTWIAIRLEYEDGSGEGVAYARYTLKLPDGEVREGNLDRHGNARVDGLHPGMCEVTFPEFDARTGAPPPPIAPGAPTTPREPEEVAVDGEQSVEKPCTLRSVRVSCAHHHDRHLRRFSLNERPGADGDEESILELIAGSTGHGDSVRVTLDRSPGDCEDPSHGDRAIVVAPKSGEPFALASGADFEAVCAIDVSQDASLEGSSPLAAKLRNFLSPVVALSTVGLLWDCFVGQVEPNTYDITVQACHGAVRPVSVRVYPDIELKLAFSLNYGVKSEGEGRRGGVVGPLRESSEPESEYSVTGSLSHKFNGTEHVASQDLFVGKGHSPFPFLEGVRHFTDIIRHRVLSATKVEVKFPLINVTLSGALKKEESSRTGRVSTVGEIVLEGAPLLGGGFEVDFLDVLVSWIGSASAGVTLGVGIALAEIILDVKRELKEKKIADIAVGLGFTISAPGSLVAKVESGKWHFEKASIAARGEFKVFGKALLTVEVPLLSWMPFLAAEAGISAEGTAAVRIEALLSEDQPDPARVGGSTEEDVGDSAGADSEEDEDEELGDFSWGWRAYFEGLKVEFVAILGFKSKSVPEHGHADERSTARNKAAWSATWFEPELSDPHKVSKHRFPWQQLTPEHGA